MNGADDPRRPRAFSYPGNSKQPRFAQFDLVNIGLFRADTGQVISTFENVANPTNRAGSQPVTADDTWWGTNGPSFSGTTTAYAFYFAIVANGTSIAEGVPQSTFTAIRALFCFFFVNSLSDCSLYSLLILNYRNCST